jgi:hypothetical protein
LRRARKEEISERPREIAGRPRVADLDRIVVDLAVARDPRVAGAGKSTAGRIGLRRVRLEITVEVPDYRIGVEVAAVVKLDAAPQVEDPFRPVVLVLLPAFGEPRPDLRELVGPCQIPQHQPFKDRVTEKSQALEPVVGRAGGRRHVGGGHRDPQRPLSLRRGVERCQKQRCWRDEGKARGTADHGNPPCSLPWMDLFAAVVHKWRATCARHRPPL